MSRAIRADYGQRWLLPPSVEEWVPEDHPARFVRDFVDALELAELGFKVPECVEGRPAYAADLLLKVWVYGYYSKIRSSRGLERACYDSMAMVWLTGNHPPDHNTLWRFWKANRAALGGVLRQSVRVAVRSEMVSFVLQAVDGTKIAAESSTAKAWRADVLEKKLKAVDAGIEEILRQTQENDAVESGSCRLPEGLIDAQARREKIVQALGELRKAERALMHPGEPEAHVVQCGEGKRLGYNAQAVTEQKNHLVVGAQVTTQANDEEQLNRMIKAAEGNTACAVAQTLADAGYFTGEQIEQAQQCGRDVLVNAPTAYRGDGSRFHRVNFTYDAERDVFICPEGQALPYMRTETQLRGKQHSPTRKYRCLSAAQCSCRSECTRQERGRTINKDCFYEAVLRQVEKQKEALGRETLDKRKQIAELPFARLKHLMGFRRWTVRGLENVRAQWNLLCATLNLKVMYGHWRKGALKLA